VTDVERHMQGHAQGNREQRRSAKGQKEDAQQSDGTVQRAHGSALGAMDRVEEAHRRHRAPVALPQAEPRVVVRVDEDASRPEAQYAATEAGA
jgi:hypothetical protein